MATALVVALSVSLSLAQSSKTSIGFYNVENLYDTIPSDFYDDTDYTPSGKFGWAKPKYDKKLANVARVIDEMCLDVIGVAEVESLTALKDLVRTLRTDYSFIHRTSGDKRGMDLALLYKGDKFIPQKIRTIHSGYSREFLYVQGRLLKERVDIVVCHMPSNFNDNRTRWRVMTNLARFVDSLQMTDPQARVVLMGDFNASPTDKIIKENFQFKSNVADGSGFMFNPFYALQRNGLGTYVYNDRWVLFDHISIGYCFMGGNGLKYHSSGIYIRDYMISSGLSLRRGYPMRTFVSSKYIGGYSDHLPVYLFLER